MPGCLSQGKIFDEALTNIKEAVEGWLKVKETKQYVDPSRLEEMAV